MSTAIRHLVPQASPVPLIRIGGRGDGAYLVPKDLIGIDACFSPGVNNVKCFEDELAVRFGIKSHMCDFSSDSEKLMTPLLAGLQTFEKKWLEPNAGDNSISLQEWVDKYSPDPQKDLMLQMDIEGAEYRNLLAAETSLLARFRIIVIEMHGLGAIQSENRSNGIVVSLLKKLSRTHCCVHAHPNNCCGYFFDSDGMIIPNVIEVTYLRNDRFNLDDRKPLPPAVPHPLDIYKNATAKPVLHLNKEWTNGQRSLISRIKIIFDKTREIKDEIAEYASQQKRVLKSLLLKAAKDSRKKY